MSEKAHENRIRRLAQRHGLRLYKYTQDAQQVVIP